MREEGREDENERNSEAALHELGLLGAELGISGPARVQRLVFVADQVEKLNDEVKKKKKEKSGSGGDEADEERDMKKRSDLASTALRHAIDELKVGENTALYIRVVERLAKLQAEKEKKRKKKTSADDDDMASSYGGDKAARDNGKVTVDQAWVEATDRRGQQKLEKLEIQVKHFKSNLVKESVRIGHDDLGEFFYARGDLPAALKHYVQTRDYCSTSKHIVSMCLNVIRVAIAMGNYDNVRIFIDKTEHVNEPPGELAMSTLRVASGLAFLKEGVYKMAAKKFIEATSSLSWSGAGGGGAGAGAGAGSGGADAATGGTGPARTGSASVPNPTAMGTAAAAASGSTGGERAGSGGAGGTRGGGAADGGRAQTGAGSTGRAAASTDAMLRGAGRGEASGSQRPQAGDSIALPDDQSQGLIGTLAAESGTALLSVRDIATLGSLCALATFERNELRQRVVRDNVDFRACLELVPHVRDLVNEFYENRYASCLQHLAQLRELLYYDFYLHDHIDHLITSIRQRALVNYTKPFSTLHLKNMATSFNTSVAGIENECKELITKGMISARIDSHNKILYARRMDERNNTFAKVLARGDEYIHETHSLILRAKIILNNMAQKQRTSNDFLAMVEGEEEHEDE